MFSTLSTVNSITNTFNQYAACFKERLHEPFTVNIITTPFNQNAARFKQSLRKLKKLFVCMLCEDEEAESVSSEVFSFNTSDEDAEREDPEEETSEDMEDAPEPPWIRRRAIRHKIPCKFWSCRFKCKCSVLREVKSGPHKWTKAWL